MNNIEVYRPTTGHRLEVATSHVGCRFRATLECSRLRAKKASSISNLSHLRLPAQLTTRCNNPPEPRIAARGVRCCAAGQQSGGLPQDWTQVVSWAQREFRRCLPACLPDERVPLAKACLLVALEEEAAASGDALHPELRELLGAMTQLRPRSAASASTWSGERLNALAAEVAALLEAQLEAEAAQAQKEAAAGEAAAGARQAEAGPGADAAAAAAEAGEAECSGRQAEAAEPAGASAAAAGASLPPSAVAATEPEPGPLLPPFAACGAGPPPLPARPPGAGTTPAGAICGEPPAEAASLGAAAAADGGASGSADSSGSDGGGSGGFTGGSPVGSFDFDSEQAQLLDRIRSSRPGAVGSSSRSARTGPAGSSRSSAYYGAAWPSRTGRRAYGVRQALYRRYPVQTLAAVNTVLFDRHGYQPCNRYGVPSDHRLSSVLEGGVGASAALSILYLEVCERLGFPLAARPLEDGRYFVLWPREAPLSSDGQRFLVDPYGRGGLLLLEEVCEIFGVPESEALRPAARRELLAALLGELRDSHWAAAAGCSAAPGAMLPLSAATALANKVQVPTTGVRAASLRRALAAAEKRLWLLPDDSEAQLQYGLLLYFSRRYDDAWIELALYLERFAPPSTGRAAASRSHVAFAGVAAPPPSPGPWSSPPPEHSAASGLAADAAAAPGGPLVKGPRVAEAAAAVAAAATDVAEAAAAAAVAATDVAGVDDAAVQRLSGHELESGAETVAGAEHAATVSSSSPPTSADAPPLEHSGHAATCINGQGATEETTRGSALPPSQPLAPLGAENVPSEAAADDNGAVAATAAPGAKAASESPAQSLVQQVELLVERIRLELEFAPAPLA